MERCRDQIKTTQRKTPVSGGELQLLYAKVWHTPYFCISMQVWDEEDLVEVTGHMSHQLTVPWNSKGFCHSEAVFSLKFVSMSRIDVRLVGERRAFQEGVVTIVSSKEPTR